MAELTLMNLQNGRYQDLPDAIDYQMSIETTRLAQQAFESLPAKIRPRFDNDPAHFLEFFNAPKNQEEAIKLGLASDLRPPPPPPPPSPRPAHINAYRRPAPPQ